MTKTPKRPWTPGPWDYRNIAMGVLHYQNITEDRKLASKAPEMAELLIKLIGIFDHGWKYDDFYSMDVEKFYDDVKCLLKEVGFDV